MSAALLTRAVGLTAAAAVAAAVAVLPAPAFGAGGATTLFLNGPAAKTLRGAGVKIAPVLPAHGGARRVALPVAAGLAGEETTLVRSRGAIRLRAGRRKAVLGGVTLRLAARARVEAKLGKRRIDLFRIEAGGRRQVDAATGRASLSGLRLKLTGEARRLLQRRLALRLSGASSRRLVKQRFGTLTASARGLTPTAEGNGGSGGGEGGSGSEAAASCGLPSTAGPEPESPVGTMARPASAVDVTAATLDWHVRESFIRYVNSGEGTSVSGGATADPPVVLAGTSAALTYDFRFPFAGGWLDRGADAADPADDTALLDYGGAVRFLYSAHEIDLTTADPEIEIDGTASRAIFSISDGSGPAERQVLVNLDLSRAGRISAAGTSYAYEQVPGAIPAGTASSTFAGFYAPGTDFGCFTLSFTTAG